MAYHYDYNMSMMQNNPNYYDPRYNYHHPNYSPMQAPPYNAYHSNYMPYMPYVNPLPQSSYMPQPPMIRPESQQAPSDNQPQSPSESVPEQFLNKTRLQDLVKEIDPAERLDEEVEEMLLQLADDFVETTINAACLLAKHRRANTIEVKDVQLHLAKNWNMWIPGFGTEEIKPIKRSLVTDAHKQRLALIRKHIKKC